MFRAYNDPHPVPSLYTMQNDEDHTFTEILTVYHLRCDACRHEYFGPEECECPLCKYQDATVLDQHDVKITIAAIDGNVEVD